MAEHGFKNEQKKDNKVDTTGGTPDNNKNDRRGKSKGGRSMADIDPALLQAIMMLLAQRGESMEPGGMPPGMEGMGGPPDMGGGPGGVPMGLPPGSVPMGPPPGQNPMMQGRMGMMPPMPGGMPPGGIPVR